MAKEVEVKILEVNPKEIKKILKKNRAKVLIKEGLQKNYLYSSPQIKDKGIIRLRKDSAGERITIKSKLRVVNGHKVVDEFETSVKDINVIKKGLEILGFKQLGITESIRGDWKLAGCMVSLVKLPNIPPYIEIEGKPDKILKVAKIFGYSDKDYSTKTVLELYNIKDTFLKFKK